MAQFNYEQYAAQQAAQKTSGGNQTSNNRTEVHFFGEFMKSDGDVAVVRFPYKAMSEVMFETTHLVDYPGRKFKTRVSCGGDSCTICNEGVKIDSRCFVKGLIYVADDNGKMNRYNAVWDRPAPFADIEIKNLINEYGDLTACLFKIRRTGTGTATRYTISIVLPNNSIYNDTTCPADFSELNTVDPAKILCKTLAQYNTALNPEAAKSSENTQAAVTATPVTEAHTYAQANVNTVPNTVQSTVVETPTNAFSEAIPNTTPAEPARQQRRYTF